MHLNLRYIQTETCGAAHRNSTRPLYSQRKRFWPLKCVNFNLGASHLPDVCWKDWSEGVEGAWRGQTQLPGYSSFRGPHAGLCHQGQGPKTVEPTIQRMKHLRVLRVLLVCLRPDWCNASVMGHCSCYVTLTLHYITPLQKASLSIAASIGSR
jgi:hypothetical protein